MIVSGYRAMWVLVMFDLPVKTKAQRKRATAFRKLLLDTGFDMLQFSVYARPCPSEEHAASQAKIVEDNLPQKGQVRLLQLTDKQFGRMRCFQGEIPAAPERMPNQLELF